MRVDQRSMGRRPMARGLVATVAATLGLVLTGMAPAAARPEQPPPREYGETGVDSGVVRIRAGAEWLPTGSEGNGGGGSSCTTSSAEIYIEDDFVQPMNRDWQVFVEDGSIPFTASPDDLPSDLPAYTRRFSPTGRWYGVSCDGVITVVPEGGPAVTVAGLMQEALNQIDPPEPPLAITPGVDALHVTQLHSWLAIEPSYWVLREATASAGRVTVVGRADPYETTWEPGDGTGPITCDAGTVWQAGLDPEAGGHCTHRYEVSSAGAPGARFELTATVRFEVSAVSNTPVGTATFPDIERTTTVPVQVGEIQAVND